MRQFPRVIRYCLLYLVPLFSGSSAVSTAFIAELIFSKTSSPPAGLADIPLVPMPSGDKGIGAPLPIGIPFMEDPAEFPNGWWMDEDDPGERIGDGERFRAGDEEFN